MAIMKTRLSTSLKDFSLLYFDDFLFVDELLSKSKNRQKKISQMAESKRYNLLYKIIKWK